MSGTNMTFAPRLGMGGEKLAAFANMLEETFGDAAKTLGTTKAAIACTTAGVTAAVVARIDRHAASEFFFAIATALKNAGSGCAELDARRIDRCVSAIYEADQRRPQQ